MCQFYYKVNTCVRPYKKMAGGDMYSKLIGISLKNEVNNNMF